MGPPIWGDRPERRRRAVPGRVISVNGRSGQAGNVSRGFLLGTPFHARAWRVASERRRKAMTGEPMCLVSP